MGRRAAAYALAQWSQRTLLRKRRTEWLLGHCCMSWAALRYRVQATHEVKEEGKQMRLGRGEVARGG